MAVGRQLVDAGAHVEHFGHVLAVLVFRGDLVSR